MMPSSTGMTPYMRQQQYMSQQPIAHHSLPYTGGVVYQNPTTAPSFVSPNTFLSNATAMAYNQLPTGPSLHSPIARKRRPVNEHNINYSVEQRGI